MVTGTELMREMEALAEVQVKISAVERDALALSLFLRIREIVQDNISPENLNSLSKSLKSNYPLNKHFRELELTPLSKEFENKHKGDFATLDRLSSEAHQSRTQAAYISGVLRPFNSKYMYRWLRERDCLDPEAFKARVENLERELIVSDVELTAWAQNVANLFKELVVDNSLEEKSQRDRPSGMVSAKSSRIYLQAWFSFVGKHGRQVLKDRDVDLDQSVSNLRRLPKRLLPIVAPIDKDLSGTTKDQLLEFVQASIEPPQFTTIANDKTLQIDPEEGGLEQDVEKQSWTIPDVKDMAPGLTIYATLSDGTGSSCNFERSAIAIPQILMWLETIGALYPEASTSASFLADIRTEEGQMRFALPNWDVSEAKKQIPNFVKSITPLFN